MQGLRIFHLLAFLSTFSIILVNGQISSPCTTSVVSTFTPCLSYITGSSANGATTPTKECCNSLKSLMSDNMDCACLVVTANVPVQLPIIRSLSLALPRACGMDGVPVQCKASGTPLPAPGPVLLGPSPPLAPLPASPLSPQASKAFAPAPSDATTLTPPTEESEAPAPPDATTLTPPTEESEAPAPPDATTLTPPTEESEAPSSITSAGIRPVLTPPASVSHSFYTSPPAILLLFVGIIVFNIMYV